MFEIRPDRLARLADQVGLVGLEAVQGVAVFVRVDRDRADAQFVGAAEDADGDFAAVGDEQSADRFHVAKRRFVRLLMLIGVDKTGRWRGG